METLPDTNPDTLGVPDSIMMRPTIVCVFDTIADVVTIVTRCSRMRRCRRRRRMRQRANGCRMWSPPSNPALSHREAAAEGELPALPEPSSNMTREEYHAAVEQAKEYIRAGDIFQVVLSQRFSLPFTLPPSPLPGAAAG